MAHRLLFRSNRLLFGSLTKMHKFGSKIKITHSYRQFSNTSEQYAAGSGNIWSDIAVCCCIGIGGGAVTSAYYTA